MKSSIKIMVFETERDAKEAERDICRILHKPDACWTRYGRGDPKHKRHAVPLERSDGKWIFHAPWMLWCDCWENGPCNSCDPEGKGICGNATYSVLVDYTVEEMDKLDYDILGNPEMAVLKDQ